LLTGFATHLRVRAARAKLLAFTAFLKQIWR
jgi:hypothetical protein